MTFFAIIISTILVLTVWQIDKHQKWSVVRKWLKRSSLALLLFGVGFYVYIQISDSIQQKKSEKLSQAKIVMRECIAGDIQRMEALVSKAVGSLNENMTIDQAESALKAFTNSVSSSVSGNDIREILVSASFLTTCKQPIGIDGWEDAPFSITLNVTGPRIDSGSGDIKWDNKITKLTAWQTNAPADYTLPAYDKSYAAMRFNPDEFLDTNKKSKAKSNSSANPFDQFDDSKNLDDGADYCAPGLSKANRLKRLANLGKVRQTGSEDYEIEGSSAHFVGFVDGSMYSCR